MAGGGGRSLEETPTWAVAVVCFVLVSISIVIEHLIHLIGKWFIKKNKKALYEALEKIKAELMLLGFISLLLTVLQGPISEICVSESVASTWHPCSKKQKEKLNKDEETTATGSEHRRLFSMLDTTESTRRVLAAAGDDKCAAQGKAPFVSNYGIHQLHIFIFVLAVFHVLYCIITWALGRAKMRSWEAWETETKTADYQFSHDPERFRFARDTSFGRRHLHFWSNSTVLLWIVCFVRQFGRSVPKVDYLTLRHGFITAHLAPHSQTKFDFQKYINRSLEEDFKVVVGINPVIWFSAVLFLLCNTHGWYSYLWLPFIPLLIILLVGTKLQIIIARMGLTIQDRGEVVKGTPTVQPGDNLFWFNSPRLILYLIHFVLFQNAFQLAFFVWTALEFSLKSCFHEKREDTIIRISVGVITQILCSYVTLPLYALVTQMGSTMNPSIFNEKVATALRHWHHTAKRHVKSGNVTPLTSRPGTPLSSTPGSPLHSMSPVNLLYRHNTRSDHLQATRESQGWEMENPHSASHYNDDVPWSHKVGNQSAEEEREIDLELSSVHNPSERQAIRDQHEIDIASADFSFDRRANS